MAINGNISDLFFNTDVSGAAEHDASGQFTGYDDAKLREEARLFLNCLIRLDVEVPTADDLIADFYARV